MGLEERVQELEEELKVVKNEIHTTLLDIQEFLLTNRYPALHPSTASVAPPTNQPAPTAVAEQPERQRPDPDVVARFKTNSVTISEDEDEDEGSDPPPQNGHRPPADLPPGLAPAMLVSTAPVMPVYLTPTPAADAEPPPAAAEPPEPPLIAADLLQPPVDSTPPSAAPVPPVAKAHDAPTPAAERDASPPAAADETPSLVPGAAASQPSADAAVQNGTHGEDEAPSPAAGTLVETVSAEQGLGADPLEKYRGVLKSQSRQTDDDVEDITAHVLDELYAQSLPFLEYDETILRLTPTESEPLKKLAIKETSRKIMRWLDNSVAVIGIDNTKQAIDMYVHAGDLPPEMRGALIRLVDNTPVTPAKTKASIREVIDALGKLNQLLDRHTTEYLNDVLTFISEVNFG